LAFDSKFISDELTRNLIFVEAQKIIRLHIIFELAIFFSIPVPSEKIFFIDQYVSFDIIQCSQNYSTKFFITLE